MPKGGGIYKVGKPYQVAGRWYVPREVDHYDQSGIASWYGAAFHGRRTANGEIYDMNALTAGHPTLPLPSYAYVTNLDNGRTILVRINDRGPYVNDRLIDLSRRSATELGYTRHGLARVRVRYAGRAPLNGNDAAERRHLAAQPWYRGNVRRGAGSHRPISPPEPSPMRSPTAGWTVAAYRAQASGSDRARRPCGNCRADDRALRDAARRPSACATRWESRPRSSVEDAGDGQRTVLFRAPRCACPMQRRLKRGLAAVEGST